MFQFIGLQAEFMIDGVHITSVGVVSNCGWCSADVVHNFSDVVANWFFKRIEKDEEQF